MKKNIMSILFALSIVSLSGQAKLTGSVKEYGDDGKERYLPGAMLQWMGTTIGTYTDHSGNFAIDKTPISNLLIVKYPTYESDTITVPKEQMELNIILSSVHSLQSVKITANKTGSYISVKPILTTMITSEGLRKAACCNLSESFDNTIGVDVEYSDAMSGAKQISMLGLSGVYSQILLENTPYVRLLSNQFGLGFIPGTWMEMISVSKGVSSVTTGYEAISGQINVEYKKPETNKEKLFLNLFGNTMGRGELNLNTRFDVKENVSTMFLLHTEGQFAKLDMNHDSFLDVPMNYQVNAMNRWDYRMPGKSEGRTMISYLWEDRMGGQKNFDHKAGDYATSPYWGMRIKTNKLNVITKNGFLLKGEYESIGTILSFTYHKNRAMFGRRLYDATQISGYVNLLYSNKFGKNERHKITAGTNFQFDYSDESLRFGEYDYSPLVSYVEMVPGIFAEYSYSIDEKLIVMPGLRFDYNIMYDQLFWTPRLHVKWMATSNTSFRLSGGKGYRTAGVIAENLSLLISNREFVLLRELKPEEAYNTGISFVQNFKMPGDKASFSVDYYYTHFVNQTIIDMDTDPQSVIISNLNGKSFSHSAQAEFILYPVTRFEIIIAYRYNSVWVTTHDKLQTKALAVPHKALLNLNYSTKFDKWKFNATLQFNSSARLPETSQNPVEYQLPERSKPYFMLNAQITKKLRNWEIYAGGENLLNVKQKNPILSADNPFDDHFDASIIYAPISGAMGYVGVRWTIK